MSIFFKKSLKPVYYLIGFIVFSLLSLYVTLSSSLPTVEEIQDMKISTDNYDTVKISKIIINNYEKYKKNNS